MGLLGMLAAGAGGGMRDASNASVQAQNQLEIETSRERLRQEFYEQRYNRKRQDQISDAKSQGLLNQATYERERSDKLTDEESKHRRGIEIEGIKTGRTESANAARIRAAEIKASGSPRGGAAGGGDEIILADGTVFKPNDATSKMAANLVRIKSARDIPHAYEIIFGKDLASQAAGSIGGLTKGMVPEAMNMSREFLGDRARENTNTNTIRTFTPKTGKFE